MYINPVFQGSALPTYLNSTRPDPTKVLVGLVIWNIDDNAVNWSDGTHWRDSDGNIT
jgi:hypothetical protein